MPADPLLARLLAEVDRTSEAHLAALADLRAYVEPDPAGTTLVPLKQAAHQWRISEDGARKRCRDNGVGVMREGKWYVPRAALRA